ncbi:hypothetical protein CUMW_274260 [Citrus unshiu]|uniref:Plastocyanin-like domain-containing protein n=1 Tax=Citrus unshiu TaxID=55188 RepID=A0A2H5MXX5_CITUN|nr:hypothetical protein CUMW_274260 [Citrus unshiu]
MALCRGLSLLAIHIALLASLCSAADLFVYFDFEVSYITASPLGAAPAAGAHITRWDGIARTTTQVYPGAWTAILVSLDNVGIWNLRTENLDSWYLGQETYVRVVNPEATNKTEFPIPDNALFCGALSHLQKPEDISAATAITGDRLKMFFTLLMTMCAMLVLFH